MQISFAQFLLQAVDVSWFTQQPVIHFKGAGAESPLLFFSLLHNKLKATGLPVECITGDTAESMTRAKIHTSFLGMTSYFWLDSSRMTEKEFDMWTHELQSYQGPHTIGVYATENFSLAGSSSCIVEIPTHIDQKTFTLCAQFLGKKVHSTLVSKLFINSSHMALEGACLLIQYLVVLGSHIDQFADNWLPKLLPQENSLFTLSTHFFGKKSKAFFEQWQNIRNEYAEIFWLTYWSEQVWRAYHFIDLTHKKQHGDAKKVSMRLPFSFMQRDWRQSTLQELAYAHQYIYSLDYALKNGNSAVGLELFYSKFFLGEFKNESPRY